jgi:hypothetical protein
VSDRGQFSNSVEASSSSHRLGASCDFSIYILAVWGDPEDPVDAALMACFYELDLRSRGTAARAQATVDRRDVAYLGFLGHEELASFHTTAALQAYNRYALPCEAPGRSMRDPLAPVIGKLMADWPDIKAPWMTELLRDDYNYTGSVDLVRCARARARRTSRASREAIGRRARLWRPNRR